MSLLKWMHNICRTARNWKIWMRGNRNWKEIWRVGWLAHDPLQSRCPRAAPNPLSMRIKARPKESQWTDGFKNISTGVLVLRCS
jgi:hypothetical protein